MKANVWLWSVLTTLVCTSQLVSSAQREFQEFPDSRALQDDFLLEKRGKPSLSIVNPLDVLRQRLLLEIARRHMRENKKQVAINRAILKNIGKRDNSIDFLDFVQAPPLPPRHEDVNNINNNNINNDNQNTRKDFDDDNDYQYRYLYSLHKNRYTKK